MPFCMGVCPGLLGAKIATPASTLRHTDSKHFILLSPFDLFLVETVYGLAPPIDAVARVPPRPMVSTAVEGTITIAPFSLMASYSMFMARRCRATGFSAYEAA